MMTDDYTFDSEFMEHTNCGALIKEHWEIAYSFYANKPTWPHSHYIRVSTKDAAERLFLAYKNTLANTWDTECGKRPNFDIETSTYVESKCGQVNIRHVKQHYVQKETPSGTPSGIVFCPYISYIFQ